MINLSSILRALAFGLLGALVLEGLIVLWNRQVLAQRARGLHGRFADLFFGPARPTHGPRAGSEFLDAAVDYLATSELLLSRGVGGIEESAYGKVRDAWLKLWTATKRETARRALMTPRSAESNSGLMELVILGENEDLERIERMLAAGYFKGPNRELAKRAIEQIRARAAGAG